MIEGTTIYSSARHVSLYHSHGVASLNVAHGAEQPTEEAPHRYEPCTLPHMALAAIRLWQVRYGVGIPEEHLLQVLIAAHSPARIAATLEDLCRRQEIDRISGCYWLRAQVAREEPAPTMAEPPAPLPPPELSFVIGSKGYGHMLRLQDPGRTVCGFPVRPGWKPADRVSPRWRCTNCLRSVHPPIAPFGG